jgi:hypothetical protein
MEQQEQRPVPQEREYNPESKEAHERDPAHEAGKALERAELVIKEINTTAQRVKHIATHAHQLAAVLKQIRAQLQIAPPGSHDPSVAEYDERVAKLSMRAKQYATDVIAARPTLIADQEALLTSDPQWGRVSPQERHQEAMRRVDDLLAQIQIH